MILLKIQDKGMMVDIPGTKKVRSPVEIDITNIDINFVTIYLRKQGIENYRIVSDIDKEVKGVKEVLPTILTKKKDIKSDGWKDDIESRFGRLESLIINFLGKKESKPTVNSEQITNKLKKLEKLSEEIIRKQTLDVPVSKEDDGPKIEELDNTFIPAIDIEGMTMKGSTIKTLQSDSEDVDEAADLLSSIVKNGG